MRIVLRCGESEVNNKSVDQSGDQIEDQIWKDRCGGSGFESEVCLQHIKGQMWMTG